MTTAARYYLMQIERIEEMRLTRADDVAIGRLLDAAFNTEFNGRSFYQNRHHTRLLVRQGGDVIGHMAVSVRAIRMGDTLCHAAGLAEVATHPDHRGEGIATALMHAAIGEARASVADFFVLFGDQPLYAASGFVPFDNVVARQDMTDARGGAIKTDRKDKLMVMSLSDLAWDPTARIDLMGFAF